MPLPPRNKTGKTPAPRPDSAEVMREREDKIAGLLGLADDGLHRDQLIPMFKGTLEDAARDSELAFDRGKALEALVDAVLPILRAYRSTSGHITHEEITAAWAAYDEALRRTPR